MRADSSLVPVIVLGVEGVITNKTGPTAVAPGRQRVVLHTLPTPGLRGSAGISFEFNVEPCTHYYFAAVKSGLQTATLTPIVEKKEPVAGCRPEEELAKAKGR